MTYLIVEPLGAWGRRMCAAIAAQGISGRPIELALAGGPAEELQRLGAELRSSPFVKQVRLNACDFSVARIEEGMESIAGENGSLDGLIYAGAPRTDAPLAQLALHEWEEQFDAALRRPWALARALKSRSHDGSGRFLVTSPGYEVAGQGASSATLAGLAFLIQAAGAGRGADFGSNLVAASDPDVAAGLALMLLDASPALVCGQVLERIGTRETSSISETPAPPEPASDWPRRVIITGGAGEIGQALCRALGARQTTSVLQVLLVDCDERRLDQARGGLTAEGIQVETLAGDMADISLPEEAVRRALSVFGGVDAVFSHAGAATAESVFSVSEGDFDRVFITNLRAAWLLAKASYAALAQTGGSFVATSSIGALSPGLSAPVYSASKAALIRLTERLAVEWGPSGVRVNSVSPGSTLTPMNRLWGAPEVVRQAVAAAYPMRRMAHASEIGAALAFMAGPDASYVSGHNLVVDGALSRIAPRS